jgi:hypothetical protein
MHTDLLLHFELANLTIAERHHEADRERLARLGRASRKRTDVVVALAKRLPRTTVPDAGA